MRAYRGHSLVVLHGIELEATPEVQKSHLSFSYHDVRQYQSRLCCNTYCSQIVIEISLTPQEAQSDT